jgi:hypothetical protein
VALVASSAARSHKAREPIARHQLPVPIRRHQRLIGASGNRQDAGASGNPQQLLRSAGCGPGGDSGGFRGLGAQGGDPSKPAGAPSRIRERPRRICEGGLCSPAQHGDPRAENPASLPGLRAGNGSGRGGRRIWEGRRGRRGGFGSGAPSRIPDAILFSFFFGRKREPGGMRVAGGRTKPRRKIVARKGCLSFSLFSCSRRLNKTLASTT